MGQDVVCRCGILGKKLIWVRKLASPLVSRTVKLEKKDDDSELEENAGYLNRPTRKMISNGSCGKMGVMYRRRHRG